MLHPQPPAKLTLRKALRATAAAAFVSALVVCAYAGGQTQRAPEKTAAKTTKTAKTAAKTPAAKSRAAAKRPDPGPRVKLGSINAVAKSGKAAKRGPSANVAQPINLAGAGFEDNVSVEFMAFANSTFIVQPQKVQGKKVTVAVPSGAITGPVRLVTPDIGKSDPLTLQVVPTVTTLTPAAAAPGTRLLIDGFGFTRDTKVAFTGVKEPVAPTVVSPTRIDIVVPAGTKAGKKTTVTVVTSGGRSKPATLTVP